MKDIRKRTATEPDYHDDWVKLGKSHLGHVQDYLKKHMQIDMSKEQEKLEEKPPRDIPDKREDQDECLFCGQKAQHWEVFNFPDTSNLPNPPGFWFYQICNDCVKQKSPEQVEKRIASIFFSKDKG